MENELATDGELQDKSIMVLFGFLQHGQLDAWIFTSSQRGRPFWITGALHNMVIPLFYHLNILVLELILVIICSRICSWMFCLMMFLEHSIISALFHLNQLCNCVSCLLMCCLIQQCHLVECSLSYPWMKLWVEAPPQLWAGTSAQRYAINCNHPIKVMFMSAISLPWPECFLLVKLFWRVSV